MQQREYPSGSLMMVYKGSFGRRDNIPFYDPTPRFMSKKT
jgi:hypothetical protein